MSKAVVLHSGGMDSSTLLYHVAHHGFDEIITLSVNYGQRHDKELLAARDVVGHLVASEKATVKRRTANLIAINSLLRGSALTSNNVRVPEGHYAEESMKQTVVPNRNAIMISVAGGLAVSEGANVVFAAMHAGDHHIYPDCRPSFVDAIDSALRLGTEGFGDVRLETPFIHDTKADIVSYGIELGVPYELTWSCYVGGDIACGRCGTCCERLEAFALAEAVDPLVYSDRGFWQTVTKESFLAS